MIQAIVNPRSAPKKMDEGFEVELAVVSELSKEADRDRGKQGKHQTRFRRKREGAG